MSLSLFATAVDSGDYVAVVGGAYTFGLSNLTTWWLGLPLGWLIVSYFVFVPIYRSGCFTNSEYLETRFGPGVRLVGALIQIQYRTNVLAKIAYSLFLTFSIPTGWGARTWWLVAAVAVAAGVYTAGGGLRAVVVTDALQSVLMLAAALTLWLVVWNHVGGWGGIESALSAADPGLVASHLHVGGREEPGVPAFLIVFGWCVSLTAYCVVNHSQAMRLLAARSEWDMRAAASTATFVLALVMWFNITLGLLGRAVYPELEVVDEAFPRMVFDFLGPGLIGVVAAGVLAGGVSSYDSIGAALAAVFTRDVYARFLVRRAGEAHYLRVSKASTLLFLALSLAYIPLLREGMLVFYLRMTSVAVVPLFTVYVLGALTRVHSSSGAAGLAAGVLYGLSSLLGDRWGWDLPLWWTDTWWAYLWGIVVPAGTMLAWSALRGWEAESPLAKAPRPTVPAGAPWWLRRPEVWAWAYLALAAWLLFRVLW